MQLKYEYILEESKAVWNEFTNGKGSNDIIGYNGHSNNSFSHSKTNPIGNNKGKALDLQSPLPKQTPQFVKQINGLTTSVTNGAMYSNGISQHHSSKMSISNGGVPHS